MRVLLINSNIAVSKLISLGVQKLGYDFEELTGIEELEGFYDVIIIDHDIEADLDDLKSKCDRLIYLLPRNLEQKEGIECLYKPFLPTDFINLLSGDGILDDIQKDALSEDELNFDDEEVVGKDMPLDGNELLEGIDLSEHEENLSEDDLNLQEDFFEENLGNGLKNDDMFDAASELIDEEKTEDDLVFSDSLD
ncbi:hypothetical protein HF828_001144, partial [Campylobacter lari]|nr:hypothetical protein [Campylobacter lari]EFB0441652.1 hypothetical protein [Campylobacter lari]EGK8128348.1 hypothetical protein [Campylobacter lari]HEC1786008.1 hypothetical protein [Campylobacter lari]